MRHKRKINKFGKTKSHRKMLFRNLLRGLFLHKKIKVSRARARLLKSQADAVITLAIKGDLASRRRVIALFNDAALAKQIFAQAETYKTRSGGYTRIIGAGFRAGDGCEMVLIQLV